MLLTNAQRKRGWEIVMRQGLSPGGVSKPELRAAVDAMDDWIEDNQVSFNTALPLPYRSDATTVQKIELFALVLMLRAGRIS